MKIIIVGAGKIGVTIAKILHQADEYDVTLASRDEVRLSTFKEKTPVKTLVLDITHEETLISSLIGFDTVISALPFYHNITIAKAALEVGLNYFDLTEDIQTVKAIHDIAVDAKEGQIFMPQCGLAPGFIGILGHGLSRGFEKLRSIKMRVGALPLYPTNQLKYNLSWSTDGLINEYCNPCEMILDGKYQKSIPLEGLEHFTLDGTEYEAFNTSGGLGTLCETFKDKVENLNYKTVRYKGHHFLMNFLLNGLYFRDNKNELKDILESSIPVSHQDVVLIFCSVSGWINGKLEQLSYAKKLYHNEYYGEHFSAIEITTATGLCTALDIFREGKLPKKGYIKQEDIALDDFFNNRFGKIYESAQPIESILDVTS